MNECDTEKDNNCHADAKCKNTKGYYNCSCLVGYEGDGFNCSGRFLSFNDEQSL